MLTRPPLKIFAIILVLAIAMATVTLSAASPSYGGVHVVQSGQTLWGIARTYGTTVAELASMNNLKNPDLILPGQKIVLPGTKLLPPPVVIEAAQPTRRACNPSTTITFPRQGDVLNGLGTFSITGTAAIDDFQFYKLELGIGDAPKSFWSVDEVQEEPVVDGILIRNWNTGPLPNGTYTLRLTVVDNQGQFPPPCDVLVKVDHSKKSGPSVAVSGSVLNTQLALAAQPRMPALCQPNVRVTFPRMGEVLNGLGTFSITGTASIDDFDFYKLELGKGEAPIDFWSIDEVQSDPVIGGILLRDWETSALPEGTYTLRLTVVDERGQFPPPCDVLVKIDHRAPAGDP
jgi:LysM repeat protein